MQPTFGRPKHVKDREAERESAREREREAHNEDGPRPTRLPPEVDWLEGDPIRRAPFSPGFEATPGSVYCWKTEDGTRYAWSLPYSFQRGEGYDVVVILHPARADFRWGFSNFPRKPATEGGFRPNDIVVSIDGMNGDPRRPNQRVFEISENNMVRFRDTMLEIARVFPSRRLYIVGGGGPSGLQNEGAAGGGEFALAFTSPFPALAEGVVVHGAAVDPGLAGKSSLPIVFLHGAKDSFVPLRVAIDAVRAYREAGHERVRLRIMRAFNDFTNPVRTSECLDYLVGMSAAEPEVVLHAAERLLTPKPADEYSYVCPVWMGGANEVLARLTGQSSSTMEDVPEAIGIRAQQLIEAIDADAARHVSVLKPLVNAERASELVPDGGAWLGYLLAFREDYRGVASAEQYAANLGLESALVEQQEAAAQVWRAWEMRDPRGKEGAGATYEQLVEALPKCFLVEALPPDVAAWLRVVTRRADEFELSERSVGLSEYASLIEAGWKNGLTTYGRSWSTWRLPPPPPPAAPTSGPGDESEPAR